jgi:N-acylglucosamine-6-phosphate 2-epimerase
MTFETLRGRLIVSCQASPGDPLDDAAIMVAMAQAALGGGAAGIRVQGLRDIAGMRAAITAPLIGLWKDGRTGVFITPTLDHALAVSEAGADIVAIDGTRRPRPDGRTLAETIHALHDRTGKPVLADVGSLDDGLAAVDAGADLVATTLSGYTGEVPHGEGPDLELVERLAQRIAIPVIAEGRISTPEQARAAYEAGAYAVVVGTAITRTRTVTSWFAAELMAAHPASGAVEGPSRS